MPLQLKQQSTDLKQLLAFVQLTGASLSFIRDKCVWKNAITTPVLTPEMYEAARTSWLKSIKRSRLRQVAGNSNADHPNLPLNYDYRNVILHKDLTEAEQALYFPHTTLTEDLFNSQFPPPQASTKSQSQATMANKNIPTAAATKARSSSVPKTPPRSRGRSVAPRATSCTPKKAVPDEVDIDSITSSMNSIDITSKDVRDKWVPEVDVDDEDLEVPVYDLAEGIEQKDTEATCIHNRLPQVDGDNGAKFEVECVSVTHTLTQQEMCDESLSVAANLIKSPEGEKGVCFTLQTDKTRLVVSVMVHFVSISLPSLP